MTEQQPEQPTNADHTGSEDLSSVEPVDYPEPEGGVQDSPDVEDPEPSDA